MEKHTLCETCIQEMAAALSTSPGVELLTAFGPTGVMILGLLWIEKQRKKDTAALYKEIRKDANGLKASINGNLTRAADKIAEQAGKQPPPRPTPSAPPIRRSR
jgi:hypothetical protein